MAWHVKTFAGEDGAGLLAAAEELADLDLNLYAAEAAAGAVTLLRAIRSPQTPRASQRLADFRAKCEGPPQTPALVVPQPTLTGRERQIAKLAAAGVPSKEIADQLYLSSRTVDNHLMRVYAKLGVNGRAELAAALRGLPPDES
jgi:DNA-binding CsgD family transcriptional regulator